MQDDSPEARWQRSQTLADHQRERRQRDSRFEPADVPTRSTV
jgi:hypothetical protein